MPADSKPPAPQTGARTGGRLIKCPWCDKEVNSHGMHMHVRGAHKEHFDEWTKDPDRLGHGVGEKKIRASEPAKVGNANKWSIPFNCKTKKHEYNQAYALCRLHKLPYAAALKKAEELKKGIAKDSAHPIASSNEAKEPPRTMDMLSPNTIATGMHVRQIKPDQGRQIFGNAVVLARVGDMIEVRNGGGRKHKIDARCLEIVPAGEASDRATGASS